MLNKKTGFSFGIIIALIIALFVLSADLAVSEESELLAQLHVEKLENGMTCLLFPNKRAPIFSAVIRFSVGSKDETAGITGISHMFEHMAFKGTQRIGTTDWAQEKIALEAVESAAIAFDDARNRLKAAKLAPSPIDQTLLQALESKLNEKLKALEAAQANAQSFVVKNEFDEIYSREGGQAMNATTSSDATTYFISLPSNRLSLWAAMESERLSQPVMREFYKERDVVMEERRMRNDSSPIGRLWELTMGIAFRANAYGYPVIGFEDDIQNLTATQALAFFKQHYTPDRAVIAIVGDIDVTQTCKLLHETFGKLPAKDPDAVESHVIYEPPQQGERRAKLLLKATPTILMAWHKPSDADPTGPVAEVLSVILTGGRSSRWFEEFVKQKRLAADVGAFSGPGDMMPNLFMLYATTADNASMAALEPQLREAVAKLHSDPVSEDELVRAKKILRADTIRTLENNLGLAQHLAASAQLGGDPYYLETRLHQLEAVTAKAIQDFVTAYMVDDHLTVTTIELPLSATGPLKETN